MKKKKRWLRGHLSLDVRYNESRSELSELGGCVAGYNLVGKFGGKVDCVDENARS